MKSRTPGTSKVKVLDSDVVEDTFNQTLTSLFTES